MNPVHKGIFRDADDVFFLFVFLLIIMFDNKTSTTVVNRNQQDKSHSHVQIITIINGDPHSNYSPSLLQMRLDCSVSPLEIH